MPRCKSLQRKAAMKKNTETVQRSYSTTGRPRRLTDSQIAELLEWHASRRTNRQMAQRYGIARGTLENIIRTNGAHYKQASPELRNASLDARRIRRARLIAQDLL
jgi:transposase